MVGTQSLQGDSGTAAGEQISLHTIATPLGPFRAVFTVQGLAQLSFPSERGEFDERWMRRRLPGARVVHDEGAGRLLDEELNAYLGGSLTTFSVPLDLRGTPFQLQVWEALKGIPYGQVRSYAGIATAIGRPAAVRAVGLANGANPIPILVPCHRVIGSNGTLTGYGGGLSLKERLLRLEGIVRPPARAERVQAALPL